MLTCKTLAKRHSNTIIQIVETEITNLLKELKEAPNLLIGFSGGSDSTCLLRILKYLSEKLNFKLHAVHLDHQWRDDSNKDALFCIKVCSDMNIPITVIKANQLKLQLKTKSLEEKGRLMRRHCFETVANKQDCSKIILAHHAQDQIETFFIRLARGASLAGLSSIQKNNGLYFRPMLKISKQDINLALQDNKWPFINDPSNSDFSFLRNRIRHKLIPTLQEIDFRFDQKILDSINNLQKENSFLKISSQKTLKDLGSEVLDCKSFKILNLVMQKRVLVDFFIANQVSFKPSSGLINEAIKFISSNRGGVHQLHQRWQLTKQQFKVWIEKS